MIALDRNERARRVGFILVALLAAYYIRYVEPIDYLWFLNYEIRDGVIVEIKPQYRQPWCDFAIKHDAAGKRVVLYQEDEEAAVLLDDITKHQFRYSLVYAVNDYGCALIVQENNAVILYLADDHPKDYTPYEEPGVVYLDRFEEFDEAHQKQFRRMTNLKQDVLILKRQLTSLWK